MTISATLTALTNYNFAYCYNIEKITFLGDLTSIGANAFYACYNCFEYDFTHCTSIPSLANANAFYGIRQPAKIKVPAALET